MIRLRKRLSVLCMLLAIVVASTGTKANAEGNDLYKASQEGDISRVMALIGAHADVNAKTDNGTTALMMASVKGHQDVVKALIAAHADVNAKTDNGTTALMMASVNGRRGVAKALIAADADVNAKLKDGGTALMMASLNGHQDVVKELIVAKADVNAKTDKGTTALMLASQKGYQEVVRLLKEAGTAPAAPSHGNSLRYDGIYRSEPSRPMGSSTDYWEYLRFYSDGSVISVSSTGQPKDLRAWFSKEAPGVSLGKVATQGNRLSFTAVNTSGSVDYSGEVDGDRMCLRTRSHINEHQESKAYVFVKW